MSAPGRRVCVQNTRDQGMGASPSALRPALATFWFWFFHFEVPAIRPHFGCLATGIEGSRRIPFHHGGKASRRGQQRVAELVSLLARPVLQDEPAHRPQPPGRAFQSLVCPPPGLWEGPWAAKLVGFGCCGVSRTCSGQVSGLVSRQKGQASRRGRAGGRAGGR